MSKLCKIIAIAGSMVVLTATGTLAASAGSDEGQAGGAKTTKQAGPSSGMKAEGRSEAKQHSAMVSSCFLG